MILDPPKIKFDTVSTVSPSISHELIYKKGKKQTFISSNQTRKREKSRAFSYKIILKEKNFSTEACVLCQTFSSKLCCTLQILGVLKLNWVDFSFFNFKITFFKAFWDKVLWYWKQDKLSIYAHIYDLEEFGFLTVKVTPDLMCLGLHVMDSRAGWFICG